MKQKIIYFLALIVIVLGFTFKHDKKTLSLPSFPLSDYIHNEYEGYMGKYFLNDHERIIGADINWNDQEKGSIYILERDLEKPGHTLWMCSEPLKKSKLGGYIFQCASPDYVGDVYIKLDMTYLDDSKIEKIIYVSITDNQECIEKYHTLSDFEKYCNPKTNQNIKYLKLYNLHF